MKEIMGSTEWDEMLGGNKFSVVRVTATWCSPCKMYEPKFNGVAKKFEGDKDIVFAKLDVDENQILSSTLGVRGVPTTQIYKGQTLLFGHPGVIPEDELVEIIDKVMADNSSSEVGSE